MPGNYGKVEGLRSVPKLFNLVGDVRHVGAWHADARLDSLALVGTEQRFNFLGLERAVEDAQFVELAGEVR